MGVHDPEGIFVLVPLQQLPADIVASKTVAGVHINWIPRAVAATKVILPIVNASVGKQICIPFAPRRAGNIAARSTYTHHIRRFF